MSTTIEPVTLTIAEELDQALVKANITDVVLQQLFDKALPHAKPIENEEQFKEAERARLDIRQVRLVGERNIEAVDRRYLDLRQASMARKKELLAKINEPELLIEIHTSAWKKKLEAEEAERQRLMTEMQEARKAAIMGTGATFVPGPPAHKYVLGSTEVTVREVMEADHETWGNLLRSFEVIAAELAEISAEKEREQKELLERLREQERKQKEAQQELERRQREMDEKEAKMREVVNEARRNELLVLGCQELQDGRIAALTLLDQGSSVIHKFSLRISDLHELTQDEWQGEVLAAKLAIEEVSIASAREALVQERVEKLKAAGYAVSEDGRGVHIDFPGGEHGYHIDKLADVPEENIERRVRDGQAELARRAAAHQEQLRQEAEAAARVRLQQEQAEAKTVTVERERLLRLLFSIQEVLPYAKDEDLIGGKWNTSIEALEEDVMELRRDLGDETLGPTF
jgi:hypothetical protein